MWISREYYNELLNTLENLSNGKFDFNESDLKSFSGEKYQKLTDKIIDIKRNTNEHIEKNINIIDSFIEGNYSKIINNESNYKEIYQRYNLFIDQLNIIDSYIKNVKSLILNNGKLDLRINSDKANGKWLTHINDLNEIINYFSENLDEIAFVVNNVAKGDLSHKFTTNGKGDVLELKKTMNTMVDQLSQFAFEVTRVSKEVGTDGILGGKAKSGRCLWYMA